MGHFEENLSVLALSHPQLAASLAGVPTSAVEILTSATGLPTAVVRRPDGESVRLHSQYDPLKEARATLSRHDLNGANYLVILGFGLGYVLQAFAEDGWHSGIRVFVVEANPAVLRAALASRNLKPLLGRAELRIAWPTDPATLAEQWGAWFDPVHARRSVTVSSPASVALDPEFYRTAAEVLQSQTSQIFTDINTLVARSGLFLENFVRNYAAISGAPGVESFRHAFRSSPAVIVSAGPSLDANVHELRRHEEELLIIATDTAVRPLAAVGVQPHFICTADPSDANYLHLQGVSAPESVLVAEATAHPGPISDFRSRLLACTFERSSLHSLALAAGVKGDLRAWGSVATMALDFALLLGCDPVIFIGQDLAYSWGRTYCWGTHYDDGWFAHVRASEDWAARHDLLVREKKLLSMTDVYGRGVQTTVALVSYWNWFLKEIQARPDVRFVNATEGGILRDGVQVMSLREALFRYCADRQDHRTTIHRRLRETSAQRRGPETALLATLLGQCSKMEDAVRQGLKLTGAASSERVEALVVRLDRIKEVLYSCSETAPIIDALNQMGNVEFLRARAALVSTGCVADEGAVRAVYGGYFEAVSIAVRKLGSALQRLRAAA